MNKEKAIEILVQVARLAQKGGLLSLEDANAVLVAINTVMPAPVEEVEEKPKAKK
tara:strand:+ start:232 stop:396 length:165 start_codon:yes stop_codon:yes gene_type:complete